MKIKFARWTSIFVIIVLGFLGGIIVTLVAGIWPVGRAEHDLLQSIGIGLLSTAFLGIILDLIWIRERNKVDHALLKPILDKLNKATEKLTKLEGRLEAFKQVGFNYCHSKRNDALKSFLVYANNIITEKGNKTNSSSDPSKETINIVSSSARGLVGYLDRDPSDVQQKWLELITSHPESFRILLTHPAFAHLRQPAEERSFGDIELEILKTAIYLHSIAGKKGLQLRFYRGSPTVFAIQAGKHFLLNPYPYGQMAMDTLCLEFESDDEESYVSKFMNRHFNHTWAFIRQPSKLVDGRALVVGVVNFADIIQAFSECTLLNRPKHLRLSKAQVIELDTFTYQLLQDLNKKDNLAPLPDKNPFMDYVIKNSFVCSGDHEDNMEG